MKNIKIDKDSIHLQSSDDMAKVDLSPKRRNSEKTQLKSNLSQPTTASLKYKKVDENGYKYLTSNSAEENFAVDLLECHENIQPSEFMTFTPIPIREVKPLYSPTIIKGAIKIENDYGINPFYLDTNHPCIKPRMICVLSDWMMEVCSDFHFQRESYYLSLYYMHEYLSLVKEISLPQLQLLGLSALVIASKLNEVYIPRLSDFSKCAADEYDIKQIETMENSILSTLTWKLNPYTIFFWTNLYAEQWDNFTSELHDLGAGRWVLGCRRGQGDGHVPQILTVFAIIINNYIFII